jgi:formiminotetrahydrofolate cyclodeaminase
MAAKPPHTDGADTIAQQRFASLLEQIAARTPAPGGGSAAACALAIAAALEQMAASFTLARDSYAEQHQRMATVHRLAGELRADAVALAERELHSYGGLLEALRLPADTPDRQEQIERARGEAIASPLELCARAAQAAQLGAELAHHGNRNLRGDAICATLLAEAACRAAAQLVALNATAPSDEHAARAAELAQQAAAARAAALNQTPADRAA